LRTRLAQLGISGGFIAVTTLFLVWGFISSNNDPLIVTLRAVFVLTYSQGLLIQMVSFLANGLVSLPAASLGNRVGPVNAILIALGIMIGACTLIQVAIGLQSYPAILMAMFVMAVGITGLQVAANPLAAVLGPRRTSHSRLNFAQTFNSLGVVLGVHYGSSVMLGEGVIARSQGAIEAPAQRIEVLGAVSQAFLLMGGLLTVMILFIWMQRRRIMAAAGSLEKTDASVLDALRSPWAISGAIAIGLYVGAEVSIGSVMINFLHQPGVLGLPFEEGGRYLANIYWGGALAGRFIGSILLTRIAAPRLLASVAMMAAVLCLLAVSGSGALAGFAALSVGLCNSVMFPTIFTITLERSGVSESSTSGFLCLAISGGAVLPLLVGMLADRVGLSVAFAVPALAYVVVMAFALRASRSPPSSGA
jgi:MFS transporter, FHS family, L-fucose permease